GAAKLDAAQLAAVDRARQVCAMAPAAPLTPIDRADREDAITAWLEAHGADPDAAASLVDTTLTIQGLDELAASTPDHALGGELNQVWMNLIDNAVDAPPENGRVAITTSLRPNHVVVHIIDNGAGIPRAIRDQIFDPFVTTKPVGRGTGLGLDIARQLARRN